MQRVRKLADLCQQLFFARIIGLRDHSGFLGPLPLPQHPKSRPFTPKIFVLAHSVFLHNVFSHNVFSHNVFSHNVFSHIQLGEKETYFFSLFNCQLVRAVATSPQKLRYRSGGDFSINDYSKKVLIHIHAH